MSAPAAPAFNAAPMVEFDRVGQRVDALRSAVEEVSFSVRRGEFVLIQGGNGAGKTALLRLAAGLESPTRGRVCVAGQDLARLGARALSLLRQSLGVVPQDLWLLDDRSALANVMLPALACGLTKRAANERARAALARAGLDPDAAERLDTRRAGGGERQRIALARALVNRPALLLVDEPVAHLEAASAAAIVALLAQFAAGGVTVLAASRDERALWPAGVRRVQMRAGRLTTAAAEATA